MKQREIIKANDPKALDKYKLKLKELEKKLEKTKKIEHITAELNYISAQIRYTKARINKLETQKNREMETRRIKKDIENTFSIKRGRK